MQHPNKILKDFRRLYRLYNQGTVFTAFDTETSSITPNTGRIIEIGAVKFSKDGVIANWQSLFNPECQISSFITELTHIDQSMLDSAPVIKSKLKDFLDFINGTVLIAHNAQFDLNFLNAECEKNLYPCTKNKVIDTLQVTRWAYPLEKSYKLENLAKRMKIDTGNSHRAFDDAKTCMEIFLKTLEDTKSVQKL